MLLISSRLIIGSVHQQAEQYLYQCSAKWSRLSTTAAAFSTMTATKSRLDRPASRIAEAYDAGPDVWSVFNPLVFPNAVNLGQGFMNFPPPDFVRDSFCKIAAERTDVHHYSHPKGRPRLRKAVANYIGEEFRKPKGDDFGPLNGQVSQVRESKEPLDIEKEVLITAGANAAIYSTLAAFLEPG